MSREPRWRVCGPPRAKAMSDLVVRLRHIDADTYQCDRLMMEAAAEIERLWAAIAHVRQRSAKACEILNEFDNTRRALEPKP